MALPNFSMRELIEAGVHFGHKTKRWNPRMEPFLYGVRNDIHIIDLQKTVPMLHRAIKVVRDVAANNGRVLFVGTKRQASEVVVEAAARCGQYYVNNRWLGGMLTNWKTIQNSIKQLKKIEEQLAIENSGFTKKERLSMERQRDKLEKSLGGIRDMSGLPDVIFIIDTLREDLAVAEAQKLGIPIVAVVDSNASVEGIDYPIPGNDDAIRAIRLYCQLISDAVLDGIQDSFSEPAAPVVEEPKKADKALASEVSENAAEEAKKTKSSTKKEAFAEVAKKAKSKKAAESSAIKAEKTEGKEEASSEKAAS